MVPKGSSKTTYSAAVMLAAMLMNRRPRAEMLLIGPTQPVADRAYDQAEGMISLSPDLRRRFQATAHNKTIRDLVNNSEMKVRTFDLNIITGRHRHFRAARRNPSPRPESPHLSRAASDQRGAGQNGRGFSPDDDDTIGRNSCGGVPRRAPDGAEDQGRQIPRAGHPGDASRALRISARRGDRSTEMGRSEKLADGAAQPRQADEDQRSHLGQSDGEREGRLRRARVGIAVPEHRDGHRHVDRRLGRGDVLGGCRGQRNRPRLDPRPLRGGGGWRRRRRPR